jgi:hypothetical protein
MIAFLQLLSGIAWLIPLALFTPAVIRIWRAPWTGPSRPDPLDVLVSPLAFVGALHVGFTIRWVLFPHSIRVMDSIELGLWSGLYVLSIIAAGCSVLAWRIARRIG